MRRLFLLAILFSGTCVWAKANKVVVDQKFSVADVADVRFRVTDIGEPVYEPLELKVSVLCKDNRASKTADVPKWRAARGGTHSICLWGGPSIDAGAQMVLLNIKKAAIVIGDAPCEDVTEKPIIDIKDLCAKWNK